MMARPTKSITTVSKNMSKAEIQARTEAEATIAALSNSKPKPIQPLSNAEKKIFRRMSKVNDSYCEADSTTLTQLSIAMVKSAQLKEAMEDLDLLDERHEKLERRFIAIDKVIQQHMNALSLPLTSRLRMANDMAKVMIEERKLQQMNGPELKEVNPLLGLLEAMK
jgi:DNA repair ATPase RecN